LSGSHYQATGYAGGHDFKKFLFLLLFLSIRHDWGMFDKAQFSNGA
jgi:hypothetical protein